MEHTQIMEQTEPATLLELEEIVELAQVIAPAKLVDLISHSARQSISDTFLSAQKSSIARADRMCLAATGRARRCLNAEYDADLAEMEGDAATAQLLRDHHTFGRMLERVQGGDPEKQRSGATQNDCARREQGVLFTAEHESQLAGISDELVQVDDQLMEDLRAFCRVPKRVQGTDP